MLWGDIEIRVGDEVQWEKANGHWYLWWVVLAESETGLWVCRKGRENRRGRAMDSYHVKIDQIQEVRHAMFQMQ